MTSRSRWLGIIALILIPASASPLGLGEITLNSYLNERLDAEISVSVSDPEELRTLKVAVASRDVFERFGIDRADMLDDLKFSVESGPGGRAVVHITSTEPVVEPFLTFLIEAQSSGGRLLREYTVLLDPPLFVPEPETPEAAPAAPIQPAPSTGAISRPRAEPAPAQTRPPPVAATTTYGPVRRNETLWGIAEQVRPDPGLTMNQVMLSLFEANPEAFDDNINRLRAGATLRVPDFSGMSRLTRGEAAAEVRRQNAEWHHAAETTSAAAAPAQASPAPLQEEPEQRLKLVPPEAEKPASVGAGPAGPGEGPDQFRTEQEALNEELLAAVTAMRNELKDTQEQIAVRDAEIAELQAQLEEMRAKAGGPGTGGEAVVEPAAGGQAPQEAPAPAAPPEKAEPSPTPPPATLAEEEGGIFSSFWTWLLIVVVVLAGGAVAWRRRQESEFDEGYESWASTAQSEAAPAAVAAGAAGGAAAVAATEDDFSSEVDDIGAFEEEVAAPEPPVAPEPPPPPEPKPAPPAKPAAKEESTDTSGEYAYPFEDTIAGATGINLEQSDPLAEADFHMAYGLYDQAADLIRKAIDREPDRTDLRMKLLDILFVWGKQDEFLEEATALKAQIGDASSGDWDRVAIMGRQICPDADLFGGEQAGTVPAAATEEAEDLDLDLGSETARQREPEGIDFDIGATGEFPAAKQEGAPAPDQTAELEIEDLGLDMDLPIEDTDRDTAKVPAGDEAEAEGEETGLTDVIEGGEEKPEEETGVTEVMETGAEESREETGLTEVLDRVEEAADDQSAVVRAEDLDVPDLEGEEGTKEMPALKEEAPPSDDDTAEVETVSEEGLELEDLTAAFDDDLDKTAEIPIAGQGPDSDTLMDEIFGDDEETKIAPMPGAGADEDIEGTRELPEVQPSDVTLSEVGTKLDLARAYLDMGDPDGARSILDEVLEEGDDAQKDEARQLLDGLS